MSKKQDTRTDESTYDAKYGYIQVMETPSGHQVHYDNTPGAERFFYRHPSGTYTEISSDGKVVNFNVGDAKTYSKAGFSFTVDENGDMKISGHSRMIVGGGAHIEVAGDAGVFAGGDVGLVGMGAVNIRAKTGYIATDGDMNMNVGGEMNVNAKGDIVMKGANIRLN